MVKLSEKAIDIFDGLVGPTSRENGLYVAASMSPTGYRELHLEDYRENPAGIVDILTINPDRSFSIRSRTVYGDSPEKDKPTFSDSLAVKLVKDADRIVKSRAEMIDARIQQMVDDGQDRKLIKKFARDFALKALSDSCSPQQIQHIRSVFTKFSLNDAKNILSPRV